MADDRLTIGSQIYNYFLAKGLQPHQAAAIAGNMAWEGGGRADLVNPGDNYKHSPNSPHSFGVGQWNDRLPALISYARQNGADIPQGDLRDPRYVRGIAGQLPLNTQLDFAWNEMQGPEARALARIQSGNDVRSASEGAIGYHRPAGWTRSNPSAGHAFDNRVSIADQILRANGTNTPQSYASNAPYSTPMGLGAPREAVQSPRELLREEYGSAPQTATSASPSAVPATPAWDTGAFWEKQMLEGRADGGSVEDLLSDYAAPVRQSDMMIDNWQANAANHSFVTPDSRAGRMPDSYGTIGNQAPKPAPWEISSGLAETLSPIAQGYGAGQMASYAKDAFKDADFGTAAGSAILAGAGMMPMAGKGARVPVARAVDPLGYYSGALEAANGLRQAKGTPEQMLSQLRAGGAKAGEIEATGLSKFLEGRPSVTRDEIVSHLEGNRLGLNEVNYGQLSEKMNKQSPYALPEVVRAAGDSGNTPGDLALVLENDANAYRAVTQRFPELRGNEDWARVVADSVFGGGSRPAGTAKWSAHSLDPSNPTYRETVLHLPTNEAAGRAGFEAANPGKSWDALSDADRSYLARKYGPPEFQQHHFPNEPNVVGHMMTSMTKHEGKPVYTIDQIQSDWGQKLRDGGVRDEAKVADLRRQMEEIDAKWTEGATYKRELNAAAEKYGDRSRMPQDVKDRLDALDRAAYDTRPDIANPDYRRIAAEWQQASSIETPGHPLVNTTDQWSNTTLRRAINQAIESGADHIAIPSGDTVLSYNPGDTAGMHGFYGRGPRREINIGDNLEMLPGERSRDALEGIVPKNLRKMLTKIDPSIAPQYVDKLETPGKGMAGQGFTLFPLTPKVKQYVKENGLPLFAAPAAAVVGAGALSNDQFSVGGLVRKYANGGAVQAALAIASKMVNRNPTDAQKESGTYKMGHATVHGLPITIENPKGSTRSGVGKDGKRWEVKMPAIYGYIKGTEGFDGDHVDVYLGPDHASKKVFVVDQVNAENGRFDEHKCMLSYASKQDALADYHKAFSDGKAKDRIGSVTEMSVDKFKDWLASGKTKKPLGSGVSV